MLIQEWLNMNMLLQLNKINISFQFIYDFFYHLFGNTPELLYLFRHVDYYSTKLVIICEWCSSWLAILCASPLPQKRSPSMPGPGEEHPCAPLELDDQVAADCFPWCSGSVFSSLVFSAAPGVTAIINVLVHVCLLCIKCAACYIFCTQKQVWNNLQWAHWYIGAPITLYTDSKFLEDEN